MIPQYSIKIADYTYNLPEEKIAKFPLKERDKCKLLIFRDEKISEGIFSDVSELLDPSELLIVNNTKVIPARLEFQCTTNGVDIKEGNVIQFKVNGTAEDALRQINDHGYAIPYQTDNRPVVKIGVKFNADTRIPESWQIG